MHTFVVAKTKLLVIFVLIHTFWLKSFEGTMRILTYKWKKTENIRIHLTKLFIQYYVRYCQYQTFIYLKLK